MRCGSTSLTSLAGRICSSIKARSLGMHEWSLIRPSLQVSTQRKFAAWCRALLGVSSISIVFSGVAISLKCVNTDERSFSVAWASSRTVALLRRKSSAVVCSRAQTNSSLIGDTMARGSLLPAPSVFRDVLKRDAEGAAAPPLARAAAAASFIRSGKNLGLRNTASTSGFVFRAVVELQMAMWHVSCSRSSVSSMCGRSHTLLRPTIRSGSGICGGSALRTCSRSTSVPLSPKMRNGFIVLYDGAGRGGGEKRGRN
ncbi:hypothetical protein STCU_03863 [Strigomonas culicis]|uniref:Uncharacterized protein n=1 Tax=Strigomonas culicis TaxID=28005 RepID=S9W4N4_9TRYP|nr:hypothetical protein STCU_03863 [Strigomonas culicis]|eukprot:EPY30840.1 hypothetical protein STCU_03863 [Strigomonas culicis]